jgi:hypothetical protein
MRASVAEVKRVCAEKGSWVALSDAMAIAGASERM